MSEYVLMSGFLPRPDVLENERIADIRFLGNNVVVEVRAKDETIEREEKTFVRVYRRNYIYNSQFLNLVGTYEYKYEFELSDTVSKACEAQACCKPEGNPAQMELPFNAKV